MTTIPEIMIIAGTFLFGWGLLTAVILESFLSLPQLGTKPKKPHTYPAPSADILLRWTSVWLFLCIDKMMTRLNYSHIA